MEEKSYKRADLWSGLALAALGIFIVATARGWQFMSSDGPGAGFFPLWYGIAMIVLSAALIFASLRRMSSPADRAVNWRATGRVGIAWLALALSIAALKLIGFVISFALLTFFIVAVMYRRPLKTAALVAIASAAGFYLVFALALDVSLPRGLFGF